MNLLTTTILIATLSISVASGAKAETALPPQTNDAPVATSVPGDVPDAKQLAAMQAAIAETLRLQDSCNASDPRLCEPEPPCDAKGQRPEPWTNCVLAWRSDSSGEKLTWVDEWRIEADKLLRRPVLEADGKLH